MEPRPIEAFEPELERRYRQSVSTTAGRERRNGDPAPAPPFTPSKSPERVGAGTTDGWDFGPSDPDPFAPIDTLDASDRDRSRDRDRSPFSILSLGRF